MTPTVKHVSDRAALIEFGSAFDHDIKQAVRALAQAIERTPPHGLVDLVPAYVNLLIVFDPLVTDHNQIERQALMLAQSAQKAELDTQHHVVPVCFEPEFAPDLEAVAQQSSVDVVSAMTSAKLEVILYGFAPGYAYMDGVPEALRLPRKQQAVRDVPAGSVIIAGNQCLITTMVMPTGWHRIGQTPLQVLTNNPEQPVLLGIGDTVSFDAISSAELQEARHG